ncbi:SMP-30/gluconolactonase/LRE family protein [Granulicoccus phenolivorans]|uniref:SMP-30/gluconolactonase/LRE family protein n=1 Tax=Granulicoccus phenolivorans TaxID=266854 RepID=UPI00138ABDB7|nr:SMP-30/gluconolactonase/LRE family protein [Granulicoccus phenolivorans]
MRVRQLTPSVAVLGEAPLWDPVTERAYWLDPMSGHLFRTDLSGERLSVWRPPAPLIGIARRASGGLVCASFRGLHVFDPESGGFDTLHELPDDTDTLFNDVTVDSRGRLIVGTSVPGLFNPATQALRGCVAPQGCVFQLDEQRALHRMWQGLGIANGQAISADDHTIYYNDSWADVVYALAYDSDAHDITGSREFVSFRDDKGGSGLATPDGATLDADGFLWVMATYDGELRRYAPDGSLDRRVPLPVRNATSMAFAGPNLESLVVTTMADPEIPVPYRPDGPLGGCLLAIDGLGVSGTAQPAYAG